MAKKASEVTGTHYPAPKRYSVAPLTQKGFVRLQVTLPALAFGSLRMSAVENNRSLSMEARTMIEAALRASEKK